MPEIEVFLVTLGALSLTLLTLRWVFKLLNKQYKGDIQQVREITTLHERIQLLELKNSRWKHRAWRWREEARKLQKEKDDRE